VCELVSRIEDPSLPATIVKLPMTFVDHDTA